MGSRNHTTSMSDQTTWKPPRMISGMTEQRDQEVRRQLVSPQLKVAAGVGSRQRLQMAQV